LAQRSRKRGRHQRRAIVVSSPAPPPRRTSSEERNAAVRASLVPLAPGERPWPVKVSVVVAALLASVNLAMYVAGATLHVGGQPPHLLEIAIFSGLMYLCAIGMWLMRYWALLGFQTLLAIGVLGFCLALVRASTLWGAALCIAVIAGGGYLFYKLVRVLSRVQMPPPPGQ
jgi:hypothetical protein